MQSRLAQALAVVMFAAACAGPLFAAPPTERELELIKKYLPEKARAKPAKPRKILVFGLCRGFRHSSIECGAKALELMGQKTGAFETVTSEDIAMFEPESLAQFDAVCMNNTTLDLFMPPDYDKLPQAEQAKARERSDRLRKALLDFVSGGKGLIGIHAATDCFYNWAEYGEMMGGYFDGHPWSEEVGVKVEEPDHPLCAAFGAAGFSVRDEIYQFRDPYSRKNLRVLLSLDVNKTNMSKDGIKRKDGDFAVTWVRRYGKGRVFYCSLGHMEEIFWNPAILQHYLDGIQYAMGDLAVDDAPSAQTAEADKEGWRYLLKGRELGRWDCKKGQWIIQDGVLARKGGGYIWTKDRFGDFVLELDFKISKGGNSGIFFRTDRTGDPVSTGIEIQVFDSYGKEKVEKHDCGAIYDCLAPSKNACKPTDEWNHCVLTCKGPSVKVELNGEQIIDMNLDDWKEAHKNPDGTDNKFPIAYKDMKREGHIGFQDHGNDVWFKNIRIRELE
ncbi:MAG TPA: DUF1080 domain-containing protein [Candidatus Brocadiia bacterium]|nr:DUF1080 domain-containing protein [Candidatus Brocadiia bacterium]